MSNSSERQPYLFVKKIEDTDYLDIFFRMDDKSHPKLILTDMKTKINYYLVDYPLLNKGVYRKRMRTTKIDDLETLRIQYLYNDEIYELNGIK